MTGLVLVTALLLRTQPAPASASGPEVELRDPFAAQAANTTVIVAANPLPSDLADPFSRPVKNVQPLPADPFATPARVIVAPSRLLPAGLVDPFATPTPAPSPAPAATTLADPFGRQS